MRRLVFLLAVVVAGASSQAQPRQPAPAFDVASIKQNATVNDEGFISGPTPGRFTVVNLPLRAIARYAYGVRDYQLLGLPGWATTTPYDITATYPGDTTPGADDLRAMLRSLLADRFGLVAHTETRELTVYQLVLARKDGTLGPALVQSDIDCAQEPARFASGGPVCMMLANRAFLNGGAQTMVQLATLLESYLNAPVADRTGLEGAFDMTLRWGRTGDGGGPAESATVEEVAALIAALPEQLGLKLERARAPVPVVVIDSVRRPTEN